LSLVTVTNISSPSPKRVRRNEQGVGVVEEWKGYDEDNYNLGDLRISVVFENLRSDPRYTVGGALIDIVGTLIIH
jgi:hypothetical protein